MRFLMYAFLGVWAMFWVACGVSALVGQGDVMGLVAFTIIGALPVWWAPEMSRAIRKREHAE